MNVSTLKIAGKRYAVIPWEEFKVWQTDMPALPDADVSGNRPAVATARAIIARSIIRDRQRRGWNQAQLARRAGIRQATLSAIESGQSSPHPATIKRIDKAFV